MEDKADVCLILEGTYPYVSGGVSAWTHELISTHKELSFTLLCILPPNEEKLNRKYQLPDNVVGLQNLWIQKIPRGEINLTSEMKIKLFQNLEMAILNLQHKKEALSWLKKAIDALRDAKASLGSSLLLNSPEAWRMLLRMYNETMLESSFLNFYWSWRCLLSAFYSILIPEIPDAKIYHSLCTGYAGALLARARLEKGSPCLLTEHGIYTNERRIEVAAAEWLEDLRSMDMSVDYAYNVRDLKDYWIDTFVGFSRACYAASHRIITLYEGNKDSQILDGAEPEKIGIISNGINYERFSSLPKDTSHPPTVALIGRIVPIKDIKSFIYAARLLKERIPDVRVWILGGFEEDYDYYEECVDLVNRNQLQETVTFTGKVNVDDYLPQIDIVVLTSISEVQPLSLLEAGAAGIPCVATDVGSNSEIVYGRSDEEPRLGEGGAVCPLTSPRSVADECYLLLTNDERYRKCSRALQKRVKLYYNKKDQEEAYRKLYEELLSSASSIDQPDFVGKEEG
jgi:polysaccharide biosynthesis protein PelF